MTHAVRQPRKEIRTMKKGIAGLALLGSLCAGCATTQQSYTTDVTVWRSDTPQQYVVEFKVSKTPLQGTKGETDLLSAPKMTVKAGQEAEIKVCDEKEDNGVFCKALVKEDGAGVNASTRVVVKAGGRETLNSAQNMILAK
jgi:hypothetical protein